MTMCNVRKHKEYGGFLPLELNHGKGFFSEYNANLMRFNSFKAAVCYFLEKCDKKNIWLPYYYCPTTIKAIMASGLEVNFYHIDKDLVPADLPDNADSIVLLVNYFGVNDKVIESMLSQIKHADIIIDNAHAFFQKPIINERIHNIYSAKKFFGVPDGAYLISRRVVGCNVDTSQSQDYAAYLLKSYELGTNAAYNDKKQADKYIAAHYAPMSKLALGLLKNVDYDWVKSQREANYEYLRNAFREINDLSLPQKRCAYLFPLLLQDKGRTLKKKMIAEKIYVPTLWKEEEYFSLFNEFEKTLAEDILFLPVDQRYDVEDMKYMASVVNCLV